MTDPKPLTRAPLVAKVRPRTEDDLPTKSEINQLARTHEMDLSGHSSHGLRVRREIRNEALNLRVKKRLADAFRQYAVDNDMSLADLFEHLVKRHIL